MLPGVLACLTGVVLGVAPARAQESPAWPDSTGLDPVPLEFDGTGISAWGPIPDAIDSNGFRPAAPDPSFWEYPVAGLWWVIRLPFALLNRGVRAGIEHWDEIPYVETVARWLSRLPDYGLRLAAEWTPTSGFRYGAQVYDNRLFNEHLQLQYTHAGGGRGDLVNTGGARALLGDSTWLDFSGSYHRRGAERYFGLGADSDRERESHFASIYSWAGVSLRQFLPAGLAAEVRTYYSDLRSRPSTYEPEEGTETVFAGDLPPGWDRRSTGMSYEVEFAHDSTGSRGRTGQGGVRRFLVGYFDPTSGPADDFTQYRVVLEQFIGGRSPHGRQLALKAFWSWLDGIEGDVHFLRLLTNFDADAFRGFYDFRFRDRGIAGLTVEYRYPVWDYGQVAGGMGMDGYVFWDGGQVFGDHETLRLDAVTHSLGVGIRLVSAEEFYVRAELAGSREDLMARVSISQVFQRARGGMFDGRVPVPMR